MGVKFDSLSVELTLTNLLFTTPETVGKGIHEDVLGRFLLPIGRDGSLVLCPSPFH